MNMLLQDSDNNPSSSSIKDVVQLERIGAHSHINGLGLNELLEPVTSMKGGDIATCGFIGQEKARKAMGIVYQLLMKQHRSTTSTSSSDSTRKKKSLNNVMVMGRSVLITGPPSTGKTALAAALSVELSKHTIQTTSTTDSTTNAPTIPFIHLSASSVYSMDVSKTEALTQAIRRAIGICIQEETEIICGEVIEIQIDTAIVNSNNNNSMKKTGRITLCTTDMETIYDLGTKMILSLQKEKVQSGDIITIDKMNGKVTKLGRSIHKSRDYDTMSSSTKFIHTPSGELIQRKVVHHVVSLHEMDIINSHTQGFLALFSGDIGEISTEIRQQIDNKVLEWKEEGRATIIPGVLFIDEVHMLDMECFTYLNRAMESSDTTITPIFIFATNRGYCNIRGTNYSSPHGIPMDLLDRLMIISTEPYTMSELRQILIVRCVEENISNVDTDALELLTRIAHESTLRYAIHLITVSYYAATKRSKSNNPTVQITDIQRCYNLFFNVQRSTARLMKSSSSTDYMYNNNKTSSSDIEIGQGSTNENSSKEVEEAVNEGEVDKKDTPTVEAMVEG